MNIDPNISKIFQKFGHSLVLTTPLTMKSRPRFTRRCA